MIDYRQFLITWISKNKGLDENQVDINVDIFENNYVDSLGIFSLIIDIELELDIVLKPEDIVDSHLSNTVEGLSNILLKKQVNL